MDHRSPWRAHGAALVTVLFLTLAVLMMSVSGTRAALAAAKSARHERDRHVALQAARAALFDAERDIAGAAGPASPRTAIFVAAHAGAFAHGCVGSGEHAGLCALAPVSAAPAWQAVDLESDSAVEYGRFTGATMPLGAGLLPARAPRYVVELLASAGAGATPGAGPGIGAGPRTDPGPGTDHGPGTDPGPGTGTDPGPGTGTDPGPGPGHGPVFRITAIGFGASPSTRVVLQAYYRRAGSGAPARRLGWREIANWPELHAAAQ